MLFLCLFFSLSLPICPSFSVSLSLLASLLSSPCISVSLYLCLSVSFSVSRFLYVSLSVSLSFSPLFSLFGSLSLYLCLSASLSLLLVSNTTSPQICTVPLIQSHHQLTLDWNAQKTVLICGQMCGGGSYVLQTHPPTSVSSTRTKGGGVSFKSRPLELNLVLLPTPLWSWINCASVVSSLSLDIIKLENIHGLCLPDINWIFTICQA